MQTYVGGPALNHHPGRAGAYPLKSEGSSEGRAGSEGPGRGVVPPKSIRSSSSMGIKGSAGGAGVGSGAVCLSQMRA